MSGKSVEDKRDELERWTGKDYSFLSEKAIHSIHKKEERKRIQKLNESLWRD